MILVTGIVENTSKKLISSPKLQTAYRVLKNLTFSSDLILQMCHLCFILLILSKFYFPDHLLV